VDVWQAISLANRHPRVQILRPGPGVGGHCIPVDPWFLMEATLESALLESARAVNQAMPLRIVDFVTRILGGQTSPKIAALGVAYKGGVGDIRDSPAIRVIEALKARGGRVTAYDPHVSRDEFPLSSLEDSVTDADCIVILTDHREFGHIDPISMAPRVQGKVLIDTRDCVDHARWQKAGFHVHVFGRGEA